MPLPKDFVVKTGWYIEDATGQRVWCCNCPGTAANRTLRHVGNNREAFSLEAQPKAKPEGATK